jgi:hypothetical protein
MYMVEKKNNNSGCLFPFGGDFLSLFALLIIDDEERRKRAEEMDDENNNLNEDAVDDISGH